MTGTTNADLSREFYILKGEMHAEMNGVKQRLDKIDDCLERIDARLAAMEAGDNQRKGAWAVVVIVSVVTSTVFGWIVGLWK